MTLQIGQEPEPSFDGILSDIGGVIATPFKAIGKAIGGAVSSLSKGDLAILGTSALFGPIGLLVGGGIVVGKQELTDRKEMARHPASPVWEWCKPGSCYVGKRTCSGGVLDTGKADSKQCPPQTYSNETYAKFIGGGPWRWWAERKIRKSLKKWAEPAFGFSTAFDAYASMYGVPSKALPFTGAQLAMAFRNFESIFPLGDGRWELREWTVFNAAKVLDPSAGYKLNAAPNWKNTKGGTGTKPDTFDPVDLAFHLYVPGPASWIERPDVAKRIAATYRLIGARTPEQIKAWLAKADAVISATPTAEPAANVRVVPKLIEFKQHQASINPWVVEFVRVFAGASGRLAGLKIVSPDKAGSKKK